jgi:hypothetical protein
MTTTEVLTPGQCQGARSWLMDCVWADADASDVARLADAAVTRAIARHYDGGIAAFIADGA